MARGVTRTRVDLVRLARSVRTAIDAGRYDKALSASTKAISHLATLEPTSKAGDIAAAAFLTHGEVLEFDDKLNEALIAREKGILLAQRQGWPPCQVAASIVQTAHNLRLLDQPAKAEKYLFEAKALIAGTGEANRDCIRASCMLESFEADLLCDAEEYTSAIALKASALAGWRKLYPELEYPKGHSELAKAITDCGWVAGEMNDDAAMADWYMQALAANERLYPADTHPLGHPDLANAYNNVAFAHMQLGQYFEAELHFAKAVRMREGLYPIKRYPDGRAEMAVSYMNLGELLVRRGDLFRAQQQYKKALKIRENAFPVAAYPNGHTDLLRTLLALARLQVEKEDAAAAIPLYERAHDMARSLYPYSGGRSAHAVLAWVLHDYGRALMLAGHEVAVSALLRKADKIFAKGSTANFLHASTLAGLGELAALRGDLKTSAEFCARARDIYEAAYPSAPYEEGHYNLATGLARLARVALLLGDLATAHSLILDSLRMFRAIAQRFFMDSAVREGLLLRAQFARLPALLLSIVSGGDLREAYETVFQTKGAFRRIQALRAAKLRSVSIGESGELVAELGKLRASLASLLFAPFVKRFAARRRATFNDLIEAKELLEQRIARAIRPELEPRTAVGPDAFCRRIPVGTSFIDVVRFARTKRSLVAGRSGLVESDEYLAFVLNRDGVAGCVNLGPASKIDQVVERWRLDIARGDDSKNTTVASELIWKPLKAVLPAETATILLSPDGTLHRLPWLALEDEQGIPMLETHGFALMTEPWLATERRATTAMGAPALVVGDIAYGPLQRETALRKPQWPSLDHGRSEMEVVADAAGPSIVLDRQTATADRLLAEIPGKRLIHVITHGFYLDSSSKRTFDFDHELVDPFPNTTENERRSARRHSALLSGLVLAGANDRLEVDAYGMPIGDRSMLTAEEIAGVDASAADLVVLSACKTNLGDLVQGEGVLGLRAAFHDAGARCVITSLWQVDDAATFELMARLYRNLQLPGLSAPDALRRAQVAQRAQRLPNGRRRKTRDWAAFVSSVSSWDCFDVFSPHPESEADQPRE
jgi:CHAT domain-containing protein/tetratricopeptide (TPR) repeat protein